MTQVLQHSSGDQQGFAAVLTGSGFPTDDPFSPSCVLAATPPDLLEPSLTAATAAFAAVPSDATEVAVPLPGGASPIDEQLATELMVVAVQIVPLLREFAFAPAIEDPSGSAIDALLRYLGRRPEWLPAR